MHPKDTSSVPTPITKSTNLFPVVGIGASAGGLEAFKKLLKAIPEDSGMAYVLVQHLDPKHDSILTELLQKVTPIPVLEISDDIEVKPNHIYVIPSNKMMIANDGILQLTPRDISKTKLNLPIDLFFNSLAEVHQDHAIGVVLSGTGSDGTVGLKSIKENGGITVAQNEQTSAYYSMPNSAIKANVVDFILSPEDMHSKIANAYKSIYGNKELEENQSNENDLIHSQIISLLRIRKGTDFTYYKQTTIRRRILRRMVINKNAKPSSYLKYLKENKPEQDILYQDLLIPVTSFFRDENVFESLCDNVFPQLLQNNIENEPIRIWIAGCSTGQEAYSMAICFKEFLGNTPEKLQIFASDLSEPAIAKARSGKYSKSEVSMVSAERLATFFKKSNDSYVIDKNIRDMCVFAVHNFLKDPPFGKMHFISCRNVLIYMEPYLQKKAMTTFHYSLLPKGILLLGKTETTGSASDLFISNGKNDKLFTRKDVSGRFMHVASKRNEQNLGLSNSNSKPEIINNDFQKTANDIILKNYTPSGVIVNEALDIVDFRGSTSLYLEQLPGKPTHNLLKMAKHGLAFELRTILHKAKKEQTTITKKDISLKFDATIHTIDIEAIPLPNTSEVYYLILFHKSNTVSEQIISSKATSKAKKEAKDLRIEQLEYELKQTHEDMRSITEEQETANEELQTENEELLSGSEELQSLNEELETSKEELQSTNEELMVVNQEIGNLNEQITASRDYAEAIVATLREPLLILDKNLRVQKANTAFYKTFLAKEKDTEGVLIYDLGNKQWNIPALRKLLEKILPQKSTFKDFEITNTFSNIGERVLLLNAREINKENDSQKLILLAIEDITEKKKQEEEQNQVQKRFQFIADAMPQKVWTADAQGKYNYFNKNWLDYTGLTFEELRDSGMKKIIHPDDFENYNKQWHYSIETGNIFEIADRFLNKEGIYKWHLSRGLSYKDPNGKTIMWVGTNTEIEEQIKEKEKLEEAVAKRTLELEKTNQKLEEKFIELEKMNNELQSFTYVSSHDLQEPLRKIQTFSSRILETEYAVLSDKGKDYFQKMNNTARRMQTLIEDLLAFSYANSNERKFENTSLNKIVEEVKNDLTENINEKKATIETHQLGNATIIRFQFRQLIQNLLSNAIKFSVPETAPHIIIKSEVAKGSVLQKKNPELIVGQLSASKNYCHISIEDNGIGFNPDYKNRIFGVFQRLHGDDQYAGTGIGLAIVKKIIDNHNGFITASAEINKGATFDIYIPVV